MDVTIEYTPRSLNQEANEMAQVASGVKLPDGIFQKVITVQKRSLASIFDRETPILEVMRVDSSESDLENSYSKFT